MIDFAGSTDKWYRMCQECGYKQYCKPPNRDKEITDSYRESKCKKKRIKR